MALGRGAGGARCVADDLHIVKRSGLATTERIRVCLGDGDCHGICLSNTHSYRVGQRVRVSEPVRVAEPVRDAVRDANCVHVGFAIAIRERGRIRESGRPVLKRAGLAGAVVISASMRQRVAFTYAFTLG